MSLLNIKVNSPNNELTSEQISALTNNNNTILFDKNTGLINVNNTHFGGNNPNQYITITNYSEFSGDLPEGVFKALTITSINKTKDQILKLINLYGQNNVYIKWYTDPSDLTSNSCTLSLSNYETYTNNENTYDYFVFIGNGIDIGSLKLTLMLVFENGILSEESNLFVTTGGYYEPAYYKGLIKDLTEGIINISTISEFQGDFPNNSFIIGSYSISSIDKSYNNILSMINKCGSKNIILYDNVAFNTLVGNSTVNSSYALKITTYSAEDDRAILIFTGDIAEIYCGLAMLSFNYDNGSWVLDTSESGIMFGYSSFYHNIVFGEVTNSIAVIRALADKKLDDYSKQYLTFTALESGTFTFSTNALQYSVDNGATWTTLAAGTASPTVSAGSTILWKQTGLTPTTSGIGTFSATGRFKVSGNIMSLYYEDNFVGQTNLSGKTYAFYNLFNECNKLVNVENLVLPATTLADRCYQQMFQGCTSLTTAPKILPTTTLADMCYSNMFKNCTSLITVPTLPATTLATYCYANMFEGCTSLITAPTLPATTLADMCYSNMFRNCTSLTKAPELSATTLASACYQRMFQDCTSLTTAPELLVTTLANGCYCGMFYGCTSLVKAPKLHATTLSDNCYWMMFYNCTSLRTAPELPATTLTIYCYKEMFYGCTSLNYIKCLATNISANGCTSYWIYGVSSTGTFVKPSSTDWSGKSGTSGIPTGWNSYTENEYKVVRKYELLHSHTGYITDLSHSHSTYATTSHSHTGYISDLSHSHSAYASSSHSHSDYATNSHSHSAYASSSHSHSAYLTSQTKANWNETNTSSAAYIQNKPTIPSNAEDVKALPDYSRQYLTIVSLADNNTIDWKAYNSSLTKSISISTDGGSTWTNKTSSTSGTTLTTLSSGQKLLIKGSNTAYGTSSYYNYFTSTNNFNVEGNIMSLIYGDNFIGQTTLSSTGYNFRNLFYNCNKLISAKNLILPATTLATYCYDNMFEGCTSLTKAPELPATTLAFSCYNNMFRNCTSLTKAPELSATTLASACYNNMFKGCTSLTTAPELPATTLAQSCYYQMFYGCTALATAPALPATTLNTYCYAYMFQGCTSLAKAPELPATTLAATCYESMFYGCRKLNYIKCLATNISANGCTSSWIYDVSSTGTFITANTPPAWTTGNSGIPTGWNSYTENEYKVVRKYELPYNIEVVSQLPANPNQNTIYIVQ